MDCADCVYYHANMFVRYCEIDPSNKKRLLSSPFGHPDWCPGGKLFEEDPENDD